MKTQEELNKLKEEITLKENTDLGKDIFENAIKLFESFGLDLSTAVNMFLRQTIRENGIPFELKLDMPNEITVAAIEEGRKLAKDKSVKGYSSIDELKESLEI